MLKGEKTFITQRLVHREVSCEVTSWSNLLTVCENHWALTPLRCADPWISSIESDFFEILINCHMCSTNSFTNSESSLCLLSGSNWDLFQSWSQINWFLFGECMSRKTFQKISFLCTCQDIFLWTSQEHPVTLCLRIFNNGVEFGISDFEKAELTLSSLPTNYNSWNLLEPEDFSTFVKLFVDLTNRPFANSQNRLLWDGDPCLAFFPWK